jgi:hypothetical protein
MMHRGHCVGGFCVLLATLLTLSSLAAAAGKRLSIVQHIRDEVRTAAKLLDHRDLDRRTAAVLDLGLLARETWEPRAFESATETLLEAADAKDLEVSDLASTALDSLQLKTDLPPWARSILTSQIRAALNHRSTQMQLFAVRSRLQTDPIDAEALMTYGDLLDHKDLEIRAQARELLAGLANVHAVTLPGPITERLKGQIDSRNNNGDRQFDASLALWTLAQTLGKPSELASAEEGLTRGLVGARSTDLNEVLRRLLITVETPPTLSPGRVLVEALRRIVEEQPPETALHAAVALALLAPPDSDPGLAVPLQRALPGYLTHSSHGIRLATADVMSRYDPARFLSAAKNSEQNPVGIARPLQPVQFLPPIRQALTNLFALPTSPAKLRVLRWLTADPTFVEEHAKQFSDALSVALASANREIRNMALSSSLVGIYNRPEAESLRSQLLGNLAASEGEDAELALALCLDRSLTNLDGKAFAEALEDLLQGESPGARRAVGILLLQWSHQRGTNAFLGLLPPYAVPRRLEILADDPHPSIAWLGVAGLISAALNPDLGPIANSCRRRLENLLEASDPSVRCRFVTMVRGTRIMSGAASSHLWTPSFHQPPNNLSVTRILLTNLLRERDPLLQEQVLRAFTALQVEPPKVSLSDPRPCPMPRLPSV